jgi:hypothetical protein
MPPVAAVNKKGFTKSPSNCTYLEHHAFSCVLPLGQAREESLPDERFPKERQELQLCLVLINKRFPV